MNKKPKYTYRVTDDNVFIFDLDGNPVKIDTYSITIAD